MNNSRYSRQIVYSDIGEEGQDKLLESTVAIIGLGALGTVSANNLCRAGVGSLKLIDRDYVELSNLQRQILYDEEDAYAEKPKAIAAYEHLHRINSSIFLKPIITDVNSSNVEQLIMGCDLVIDATDNMEVRLLLNEACDRYGIPWIYCGAVGSIGMTMNIIPGVTPCFRCILGDELDGHSYDTCNSVGVLNMITNIIASVQSAEAIKMLIGSEDVRKSLYYMDVWHCSAEFLDVVRDEKCQVCGEHHYSYLDQAAGSYTEGLCGRNEIQVIPMKKSNIDFSAISKTLGNLGEVHYNKHMLKFQNGSIGIKLFKDGRAIIENAKDANNAKSIYSEYFGL